MENTLKVTQTQSDIKITLNNGNTIPLIGFGTWKLDKEKCVDVIYNAIKMGYRHIDCAAVYCNQVQVGKGIKKALDQKIVQRKDLFITSKLWNAYHRPQHVQLAAKRSLSDLGLEYLDLYLMHYPLSIKFAPFQKEYPVIWKDPDSKVIEEDPVPLADTWKAMEQLVKGGLCKSIGVSNFNVAILRDLYFSSTIKPAVVQNEVHPYNTSKIFIRFCKQKGIHVTSYSTLGGSSYVEITLAEQKDKIVNNQKIQEMAKRLNKTATQVVLRWALQNELSVLPKSTNPAHMEENKNLLGWKLNEEDCKIIDDMNRNQRYCDSLVFMEKWFNYFLPLYE